MTESWSARTRAADITATPDVAPTEGAVRSHRRTAAATRTGRLGCRAGAAALIVATLAVGHVITSHTPDADAMQKPFLRTAAIGKPVNTRTFDATVLGVRGAAVIRQNDTDHDTSGVWIIVNVRLVARSNPATLGYAVLRDAQGRTYAATTRIDQFLTGGRTLEPGVPVTGEIAFEVPVPVATHLSVDLAGDLIDTRMDAMTDIPIPETAAQVAAWRAQTAAATVTTATALR